MGGFILYIEMRKFSQPVGMSCTYDQFKTDLETPLNEMGYYTEMHCSNDRVQAIVTLANNVAVVNRLQINLDVERHWIDGYNPELFLAIAGMCDDAPHITLPYRYFTAIKRETLDSHMGELHCHPEGTKVPMFQVVARLRDIIRELSTTKVQRMKTIVLRLKINGETASYNAQFICKDFCGLQATSENINKLVESYKNNPHYNLERIECENGDKAYQALCPNINPTFINPFCIRVNAGPLPQNRPFTTKFYTEADMRRAFLAGRQTSSDDFNKFMAE